MYKSKFLNKLIIICIISKILSLKSRDKKLTDLLPQLQIILTVYDYGKNRTSYKLTPKSEIVK
jgi:hypothetical protein